MRTRLFLIAATLVAFGASLGSSFHFDDYAIFSDPVLISGSGWREWIWHARPLTYVTFWLNYQIGGGDPLGYHLLNLLLHMGAVLLVYDCLTRLLGERSAALAAAIFAIHPIQAEAVNYIWGRSIVLASLLCLASLLAWLKNQHWVAAAWFVAALLANEQVAAFPLALLLLTARRYLPMAAMLLASVAASARAIHVSGFPGGITPWHYFLAQGTVILRYVRLLIVPYGFTIDPDIRTPGWWIGCLAWIVVVATLIAVHKYAGRRIAIYYAAALILLLPSSSIFPAGGLSADRRMYLPMLALAAVSGLLLERVQPISIALIVLVGLTGLSFARTMVWITDASLWAEAVRRAPDKVRPKIQLARSLPASRALELLNQARELAPNDPEVAAEIGKTLLKERQPDAALTEFARALALNPRDASLFNNRGVALQQLGQIEAARADFKRALELNPGLTEARQNLQKLPGQ